MRNSILLLFSALILTACGKDPVTEESKDCEKFDAQATIKKLNLNNNVKREIVIRNLYVYQDATDNVLNTTNVLDELPLKEYDRNSPANAFKLTNIINGDELQSKSCDSNTFNMKSAINENGVPYSVDEAGNALPVSGIKIITKISDTAIQETQIIDDNDGENDSENTKKILVKVHRWATSPRSLPLHEKIDAFTLELTLDFLKSAQPAIYRKAIESGYITQMNVKIQQAKTQADIMKTAKPRKRELTIALVEKTQPMISVPVKILELIEFTEPQLGIIADNTVPAPSQEAPVEPVIVLAETTQVDAETVESVSADPEELITDANDNDNNSDHEYHDLSDAELKVLFNSTNPAPPEPIIGLVDPSAFEKYSNEKDSTDAEDYQPALDPKEPSNFQLFEDTPKKENSNDISAKTTFEQDINKALSGLKLSDKDLEDIEAASKPLKKPAEVPLDRGIINTLSNQNLSNEDLEGIKAASEAINASNKAYEEYAKKEAEASTFSKLYRDTISAVSNKSNEAVKLKPKESFFERLSNDVSKTYNDVKNDISQAVDNLRIQNEENDKPESWFNTSESD